MLVKTLMIIIGAISTTVMIFVALIWGGTFFENIDLSNIPNPIDAIGEHAERVAEKVNEMLKGADDEAD